MGFDNNALKVVLESFVEDLTEESADLIVERPRFAYAVVILADANEGEICQASCTHQLDVVENTETTTAHTDEQIERALRELFESREMLRGPSITNEEVDQPAQFDEEPKNRHILTNNNMSEELHHVLDQSPLRVRKSDLQFHSLRRAHTKV
ncbi:unnamed protein product [Auanema sp. JU1783]|nr:unnamed protein product [Auanema sp. JU1783]